MGILNFLALKLPKTVDSVTSKSTKIWKIDIFARLDFLNKKVCFTTVCALVRRESHVKGSKTYLHLLYTHIDMQICIKAALLPFQKRTNQRWQPCSGTGPLRPWWPWKPLASRPTWHTLGSADFHKDLNSWHGRSTHKSRIQARLGPAGLC